MSVEVMTMSNNTMPIHVFAVLGPVLFAESERRKLDGDHEAAEACKAAAEAAEVLFAALGKSATACYNADKRKGGSEFTRDVEASECTPNEIVAHKRSSAN